MEKDSSSGLERAIPALIKSSEASQCLLESLLRLGVALLRSHTNEVSLIAVVPSVPCLQETSCLWRGDGLMRRESWINEEREFGPYGCRNPWLGRALSSFWPKERPNSSFPDPEPTLC